MTLNFPNGSRSYDPKRCLVHFWGYDSALEISFFVEAEALYKLNPRTAKQTESLLETFDAARDRIHGAARKVYSRAHKDAYLLVADDF